VSKPSEETPVEDELQTPPEAAEQADAEPAAAEQSEDEQSEDGQSEDGQSEDEPAEVVAATDAGEEPVAVAEDADEDADDEDDEDDEGDDDEDAADGVRSGWRPLGARPGGAAAGQDDATDRPALLRRVGGLALVALVVPALVMLLFAWPAGRLQPHGVQLVVTGAGDQNTAFAQGLQNKVGGSLKVTTVKDAAAATSAVRDRKAAAAVVLEKDSLHLIVSTAAQPTVALDVYQLMQALQQQSQIGLTVDDVVPASQKDGRQYVLAAGLLALLASSVAVGGLIWRVSRSAAERTIALLAGALVSGIASAVVLHQALGALTGSLPAEAGVLALVALAVSSATVACGALAEGAGIGVAALVLVAAAYPLSGVSTPREVLPSVWGTLGGLLPPGAGVDAVRSVSFFGGSGSLPAFGVLAAWSVVGLLVIGARDVLARRAAGPRPSAPARGGAAAAAAAKPVHPARGRVSSTR